MRLNVWISFNGLKDNGFTGKQFPYKAFSPYTDKKATYNSLLDIHLEIVNLYNRYESRGYNLGETLYLETFFFADHHLLIDSKIQNRIKEYRFCKMFSVSPYPTLQETPFNIVEDFFVIDNEYNKCIKSEKDKQKKGNK